MPVKKAAPRRSSRPARDGLDAFYPPSPRRVPDDLTQPSLAYQQGVVLLLGTLTLFLVLYLGMLIGSGCLIFWSLRWFRLAGLPLSILALIVFLYLLKGFFKSEQKSKSLQVEITEEDQPRLFAFLYRLCDEMGAAPPHRVFLTPDVNAAASYERSLLGLLRPTPKNLILGLGLVNVLTLSELKAVLAHEFGHFAQGSMKLGVYVYAVNRVLYQMVASRDWLERTLLQLRSPHNIIGVVAALAWGLVWGLRQAMTGVFYAINFLDKSLSRQMEFHADLMAVSVTGSEAIVRGLARLEFANEALEFAAGELKLAANHGHYSRDLFLHQRDAMKHLRQKRRDPHLGEPPPLPDDPRLAAEVFDPEDGPPQMWADHPSNYDREQNAKRRYVRCPLDDRSAWLLFDDAALACEDVTWRFYRVALKIPRDTVLEEPEAIQKFLHEEQRAVTYDPRYHGLYDDRFIEPGDLNELVALADYAAPSPEELRRRQAALYSEALEKHAATYQRHLEERSQIATYRSEGGRDKKEPLVFRGRRYRLGDIKGLLRFVDEQLAEDRQRLAETDREVLLVYYHMSRQLGKTAVQTLCHRYKFHLELQRLLSSLLREQNNLESALLFLAEQKGEVSAEEFDELVGIFRGARKALWQTLEAADELRLPPLPHVKAGARLGRLLWDRPLVGRLGDSKYAISLKKIEKLHYQLTEVIERSRHMHFKSLGAILALQEEIARRWLSQCDGQRPDSTAATRTPRE